MLRIHDIQQLEDGRVVEDEILIFRDGLTVLVRGLGQERSRVVRADAAAVEIDGLKEALVENAVDLRSGRCDLSGAPRVLAGPLGTRTRTTTLSWFGVGGKRARHFALGHTESAGGQFGQTCAVQVQQIASQALAFAEQALSGPSSTKDPDEHYPRSLLFEIRNDFTADPDCMAHIFRDDTFLFRDGVLVRQFVDSEGSFTFTRAQVDREARRQLSEALAEERIGSFRTLCRTWFFLPFTVDGRCLDYTWDSTATWFGRSGRRGFITSDQEVESRCSSSELRVRTALVHILLVGATDPAAARVSGVLDPS